MGVAGGVVGAQVALSAASAYKQSEAAGTQERITRAEATIGHAQQEFELARSAAIESEKFRRDLASTVSSASARGGTGMVRQFGSQAFNTYSRDIEAINRAYKINDIQKQNKIAQAQAIKASTQINSIVDLGKNILGAGTAYHGSLPKASTPVTTQIAKAPTAIEAKTLAPTVLDPFSEYSATNLYAPASNISGTSSGKWKPLG